MNKGARMFSIPFTVEKSIYIKKPVSEVFKTVGDFSTWKAWSPWLCQEKDCPIEREGSALNPGHKQSWDGKRIGKGSMTLENIKENKRIDYSLIVMVPWKSTSEVHFSFSERDGGTDVRWYLKGSVPIFLFFFKKMMTALIGHDYQRGLSMLKEYLETGSVLTDSEINGEVQLDGYHYVGINHKTTIDQMPNTMEQDFANLFEQMSSGELPQPDHMISLYHKYDIVKGICEFTSAFAYKEKPSFETSLIRGTFPKHKGVQVTHTGRYNHLGNAWTTAIGYQRAGKYKINNNIPMYEVYVNNPQEVEISQIKTQINIPVK